MSARAYFLIEAAEGKALEASKELMGKPGIVLVDYVLGPPDIVMTVEADDAQKLADLTVQALASIEHLTSSIQCLPVNDKGA